MKSLVLSAFQKNITGGIFPKAADLRKFIKTNEKAGFSDNDLARIRILVVNSSKKKR